MWGSSPRTERKQNRKTTTREEGEGPQRVETTCTLHSGERTQIETPRQKNKKEPTATHERMRFPSTALLAQATRENTVLILECRESLELPRQPAEDAAVAARLVLAEK